MILTCPACDTKYVVKDGAIPAGGRQVRCASCKHSWHQEAEESPADMEGAITDFGGPPPPFPESSEEALAGVPAQSAEEGEFASEPLHGSDRPETSPWGTVSEEPSAAATTLETMSGPDEVAMEEAPAVADEWRGATEAPVAVAEEEEFSSYAPIADEESGSGRRWALILGVIFLIAVAAAAFWFLAPPEWKARAGLAQAGSTPLQLMITTRERQTLQSGNELILISGRVINPTDKEQKVPPIQAELRDQQTQKLVHRWTIAPPARVLAPGSSASFNSAEVDVPQGGELLTITLGA